MTTKATWMTAVLTMAWRQQWTTTTGKGGSDSGGNSNDDGNGNDNGDGRGKRDVDGGL
jgi:hypothetical protein